MKFNAIAITLVATGYLVAASPSPHRHRHRHAERQAVDTKVVTIEKYEIDGRPATLQEVCDGLKSGQYETSNGAALPQCAGLNDTPGDSSSDEKQDSMPIGSDTGLNQKSSSVSPSIVSNQTPSPVVSSAEKPQNPSPGNSDPKDKQQVPPTSSGTKSDEKPSPVASSTNVNSNPSAYSVPSGDQGGQGLHRDFPDGEIDCSEFPSDYGPIPIDWMGIGGWSGIQYVTIEGGFVTHIDTAVPGGPNCSANAMCSYACPEGYQKSQWPSTQGSAGESVGGLKCNSDGKLALTNPDLSRKLCVQGTGSTKVQNNLQSVVSICRTDYPGTENEVVPLGTQPGSTHELTCPDSKQYFYHEGAQTSAQYYVNRKGIGIESACIWGKDGTSQGNWAPSVFGVGKDDNGRTWLSIGTTTQNHPTAYEPLDYTVTIIGDDLGGKCRVQNGRYCGGDNYELCNDSGCTVELKTGTATYVLSD